MMNIAGSVSAGLYANTTDCEDTKAKQTEYNKTKYNSCLYNSQDTVFKYQTLLSCLAVDHTDYCKLKNPTTHAEGNNCVCNDGYQLNSTKTSCEVIPTVQAENPFAHILSDALKNQSQEATTTKKAPVVKVTPKPRVLEISKPKKMPEVIATTTITTAVTPSITYSTTTQPVAQNKPKTKWYSSFFSRFFGY
jgi:hypothetical protein